MIPGLGHNVRSLELIQNIHWVIYSVLTTIHYISHRIHGAGIYANIKGVY